MQRFALDSPHVPMHLSPPLPDEQPPSRPFGIVRTRSSAGLERLTTDQKVGGSNPSGCAIQLPQNQISASRSFRGALSSLESVRTTRGCCCPAMVARQGCRAHCRGSPPHGSRKRRCCRGGRVRASARSSFASSRKTWNTSVSEWENSSRKACSCRKRTTREVCAQTATCFEKRSVFWLIQRQERVYLSA